LVDVRRLVRLLQRITNELAYLHARAGEDRAALRADVERLSGLKYRIDDIVAFVAQVSAWVARQRPPTEQVNPAI
jgi:hypothetical protein